MSATPDLGSHSGALRRRLIALERENSRLLNTFTKKHIHSYVREGRAIRRLVNLVEPIGDLVDEYDRRLLRVDDEDEIEHVEADEQQQRKFRAYRQLIRWCPSVAKLAQAAQADENEMAYVFQELKKGADAARGDDANVLKRSVAIWLNQQTPHPTPLVAAEEKGTRGFYHELTGSLICPVDYNWLDTSIRNAIRTNHPNYPVTAYMWPSFLYARGQYNSQHPASSLFKGELLVRAFRCVFTSPSSARQEVDDENSGQPRANNRSRTGRPYRLGRRPRCDVAGLLKMRSVQPRAIAYIAVQLRFALSSSTSWDIVDEVFDYGLFYDSIVDWFEQPKSEARAQAIEELLQWWNCAIFGARHTSIIQPVNVANLSVAASMN